MKKIRQSNEDKIDYSRMNRRSKKEYKKLGGKPGVYIIPFQYVTSKLLYLLTSSRYRAMARTPAGKLKLRKASV